MDSNPIHYTKFDESTKSREKIQIWFEFACIFLYILSPIAFCPHLPRALCQRHCQASEAWATMHCRARLASPKLLSKNYAKNDKKYMNS